MSKRSSILTAIATFSLLFSLSYSAPSNNLLSSQSSLYNPTSRDTTISALIPQLGSGRVVSVNVFGYTSPSAIIYLTGKNITTSIVADSAGYFYFSSLSIPEETKEICLYAKDKEGRTSQSNCIPIYFSIELIGIGPIILSPTFSVAKREFAPNENIQFGGRTIPNKAVYINLSSSPETIANKNDSIIKYETVSKSDGSFSLTTSSNKPQKQQAYSNIQFNGKNSPKSTTLTIEIMPWWLVILRSFIKMFAKYLLELALITEVFVAILYYLHFKSKVAHPLAIYRDKSLAKIENHALLVS